MQETTAKQTAGQTLERRSDFPEWAGLKNKFGPKSDRFIVRVLNSVTSIVSLNPVFETKLRLQS